MRNGFPKSKRDDEIVIASSGNVFADLGVPSPGEALLKSELARQIGEIIRRKSWTQAQAAAAIGVDQPGISALLRGRLREFSIDRLVRFLYRLDQDVQIIVQERATPRTSKQTRKRSRATGK
jgi:predicted XRE-type DNA-binding protein